VKIEEISKRIQKLSPFWKRFILFGVTIVVAVPLSFLVVRNFQKKMKEFEKGNFLEKINFPKEKINQLHFKEVKEEMEKLNQVFKELEKLELSTSSTSVNPQ